MEKEEFLRLLPKLIRENDEVKGAIISALSEVVATKDDIKLVIKKADERFEKLVKSIKLGIEESNKRFEKMDERFEKMDKRFEKMDERFEKMDKRFEKMDKRFQALQRQTNLNYTKLRSAIDNLGSRGGIGLEEMVLKLLKEQHKLKDINISRIERKTIVDEDGDIFPQRYSTDIDILMENDKLILMEIKFKVDNRDIYHFVQVSKLYEILYEKPDELWVLTLEISPKTLNISNQFPVKVIYGHIY
jgi:hypothetical protein